MLLFNHEKKSLTVFQESSKTNMVSGSPLLDDIGRPWWWVDRIQYLIPLLGGCSDKVEATPLYGGTFKNVSDCYLLFDSQLLLLSSEQL